MGWLNRRKPRDLIADANAEWEKIRAGDEHERMLAIPTLSPSVTGMSGQEFQSLVAAGGWCAPSVPSYFDLPEIQIRRGGIKWPTN